MTASTFVDTNVFVYAYDANEPEKRAAAREFLRTSDSTRLVISTQVLQEFYWVTTRKIAVPLSAPAATAAVSALASLAVVPSDSELVLAAIALSQDTGTSIWDSLILEAALLAGCERLVTEDLSEGMVAGPLRIENPFRSVEI